MALASACDIKDTQHYQNTIGPTVRIVGNNIDPTSSEIPADGVLQFSFDRYLLPSTTTRQGYAIADNTNHVLPPEGFQTIYDPVARTISITGPSGPGTAWLTPGLDYKLVFFVPPNNTSDIQGFRAIDRAPLDPNQNRTFVFKAGAARGVTAFEPKMDFCADVLPIFVRKCDGPLCHGSGDRSASSLILTSGDGVRVTAVGRVAQGSNTGGRSFTPSPAGPEFGVDMALIEKGNPGASWLMYKIEMAPHPVIDASTGVAEKILCTPPPGATPIPSPAAAYAPLAPVIPEANDSERARLEDYILGRYMPYPTPAADAVLQPLTFDERERVRIWIAAGAETRDCGGCGTVTGQ